MGECGALFLFAFKLKQWEDELLLFLVKFLVIENEDVIKILS